MTELDAMIATERQKHADLKRLIARGLIRTSFGNRAEAYLLAEEIRDLIWQLADPCLNPACEDPNCPGCVSGPNAA